MELTPVRVRGKKRPSASNTPRPRGRPPRTAPATSTGPSSRASTPASTTSKRSAKSSTSSTRGKRRKITNNVHLSRLEQLPAELLQTIFLYSMNIALPRSSPNLAAKLSSEHVYMGYSLELLYLRGFTSIRIGECEVPGPFSLSSWTQMQSELFRCRLFTWEFYKKYATKAYEMWTEGNEEEQICAPCFHDPGSMRVYYSEEPDDHGIPAYLRLMGRFEIPEKLLCAPWTEDKVAFLYFLVWMPGTRIDWEGSSAGETATEGLWEAIRARSRVAVASLLHRKIGVRPTTEMVRLAVIGYGCDRTIVYNLLKSDYDGYDGMGCNVNYDDSELWAWAQQEEQKGNIKGQWLKKWLRYAANRAAMIPARDPDETFEEGEDPCNPIKLPTLEEYLVDRPPLYARR